MASHNDWGIEPEAWFGGTPDDAEPDPWVCEVCGHDLEREDCWKCHGEGGFHDCGEDCCCCLEPEDDLNEDCEECGGDGFEVFCPNAANHPPAADAKEATDGRG